MVVSSRLLTKDGESTLVFLRNMGSRIASSNGRRTGAYVADTAYLVGYCKRHLNCNVMSPFFVAPRVMIIFVPQCVIIIMFGCKLLMKNILMIKHGFDIWL